MILQEAHNHMTMGFVDSWTPQQSTLIPPDLTSGITRIDENYCEAGGFADVYKCRYRSDDGVKEVAVKALRFRLAVHDEKNKMIRRELGIWKRVSHPNIVPFLGITYGFGREGNVSLVSPWMAKGTLRTFLENHNDRLTDPHRLQLLLDISDGLSYLHASASHPIVHGDLSCNNVLLDDDYTARLVDFGLASAVGELPEALVYLRKSSSQPGAIRWAAPEYFKVDNIERTTRSDIYSLGNMIFLVLSGKYPWSEVKQDNAVMMQLHLGYKPARPTCRPIQDPHWALVERCWASIDQRPPAEDVVSLIRGFLHSYPPPPPLRDLLCGS